MLSRNLNSDFTFQQTVVRSSYLYTFPMTGSVSWKEVTSSLVCWSGTITSQPSTVLSLHGSDLKSFLPLALLKIKNIKSQKMIRSI